MTTKFLTLRRLHTTTTTTIVVATIVIITTTVIIANLEIPGAAGYVQR